MRLCRQCKILKPAGEFGSNKARPDGLHIYCRPCANARSKQYRAVNYDKWLAAQRRRQVTAKVKKASVRQARQQELAATAMARKAASAERRKLLARKRYAQVRAEYLAKKKAHREANPERHAQWKRKHREKRRSDPAYVINNRVSSLMHKLLRRGKCGRAWRSLLDYDLPELMAHLERQFVAGMGWHNMGEWHIDHIIPASSFLITGPDCPELKRAWALTNLRPLWGIENIRKGAKRLTLI